MPNQTEAFVTAAHFALLRLRPRWEYVGRWPRAALLKKRIVRDALLAGPYDKHYKAN